MYGEEFHTLCQNQSLKLSWCFQTNPVQGYITITVCMYLLNEIKRNNLPSYLYNMYRYSISDQHLKKTYSVSFKMPIWRSTRYFYSQKQDCRQPGEPAKSWCWYVRFIDVSNIRHTLAVRSSSIPVHCFNLDLAERAVHTYCLSDN